MSNLPGNPHAESWKDESDGQWGMTQAILALAYEQRTANLLKVLELQGRMQGVTRAFNLSEFAVAPRLGLGETND